MGTTTTKSNSDALATQANWNRKLVTYGQQKGKGQSTVCHSSKADTERKIGQEKSVSFTSPEATDSIIMKRIVGDSTSINDLGISK